MGTIDITQYCTVTLQFGVKHRYQKKCFDDTKYWELRYTHIDHFNHPPIFQKVLLSPSNERKNEMESNLHERRTHTQKPLRMTHTTLEQKLSKKS